MLKKTNAEQKETLAAHRKTHLVGLVKTFLLTNIDFTLLCLVWTKH